ncbi:MAG: glycoside hydrolase family 5 protein [Clostridia bacterium]|nr:glycoside hydrolase family 5 protein [Clostridia bacterium]
MRKSLSLLLALCLLLTLFVSAAHADISATVPDLTITRRPIPENEAMEFLKKMGVGWNLGNTFDAIKNNWNRNADEMTVETSWVGVKTTEAMIEAIHAAGFSSIRIPISWHDHVSGPDHEISEKWLNRVQEVVNWAYDRGMYVIINIHHDEDQFLPASSHYAESAHYVECIWKQLAARFRDYDERLIMESLNEPRLVNTSYEWIFDPNAPECIDAADCLNRLNQLFVDTVRATGGNNATRYLMVPAYDAAPGNAVRDSFVLPTDSADNKIIVSVHAYTPYDFALNLNGGGTFGTQAQKQDIVSFMNSLYNQYVVSGIPVVIGEYGAMVKGDNLQDRVDWAAFYVATASARNMPCLYWDNNVFSGTGERFGLLERKSLSFPHQAMVDAIIRYGGWDKLPEAKQ